MRVVIDTSVMVSALLWAGPPHRILQLAEKGQVTLCATKPMLDELAEVLLRAKFQRRLLMRRTTAEEVMAALVPMVELYESTAAPGSVPADPDDEVFIACALGADAEFLVSGDEHLLGLERYGTIRIVSPADFLRAAENRR